MDFDFNDDQRALREAVRDALSGLVPTAELQAMTEAGGRMPDELWRRITELGWQALLIPEEYDGLGLGLIDMTVVMEEMGKVPLPGPFFSSAVFATVAAIRLGATELLPDLASGAKRGTVAVDELAVAGDPLAAIGTTATGSGTERTLTGLKPTVPDGPTADWVIVVARDDEGLGAYLIENPSIDAVPALDPTRELGRLALDGAAARRIGPDGDQTALIARIVDDAAVMLCAELVGASESAFELAAEYSKSRVQFGRPIGTFQAVKHIAAEMLQELTLARVITHYAAWCSDVDDDDRELSASMAKSFAPEAAIAVTNNSIQIHGAVGFTWECPAHFYYKRAKATDLVLGKQSWQRERVADLILGAIPA